MDNGRENLAVSKTKENIGLSKNIHPWILKFEVVSTSQF